MSSNHDENVAQQQPCGGFVPAMESATKRGESFVANAVVQKARRRLEPQCVERVVEFGLQRQFACVIPAALVTLL